MYGLSDQWRGLRTRKLSSTPNRDKALGDFFSFSVLVLVNRIAWYLLLEGGDTYLVELVKIWQTDPDNTVIKMFNKSKHENIG